jgi:hypothetical protein
VAGSGRVAIVARASEATGRITVWSGSAAGPDVMADVDQAGGGEP